MVEKENGFSRRKNIKLKYMNEEEKKDQGSTKPLKIRGLGVKEPTEKKEKNEKKEKGSKLIIMVILILTILASLVFKLTNWQPSEKVIINKEEVGEKKPFRLFAPTVYKFTK